MNNFVFFGFCFSDIAAIPWIERGFTCIICDIKNENSTNGKLIKTNCNLKSPIELIKFLHEKEMGKCLFAGFFPPCTHLAVSGSRWFKGKGLRLLQESIGYFATSVELAEHFSCPYFIENPVSSISTYWRKPCYTFNPFDYTNLCENDNYSKKTCLWTGGGFIMPEEDRNFKLEKPDSRIHFYSGKKRQEKRSLTPEGFSRAVFRSNIEQIMNNL